LTTNEGGPVEPRPATTRREAFAAVLDYRTRRNAGTGIEVRQAEE
jgi:hypothetical protein